MEKHRFGINSFLLHIIAMALMLCDHMWATVIPGNMWLTNIGRLAFPIFAFMIVEGYFNTKNLKKYLLRLLIAAVISEIPFNLMYGGSIIYPYHQNVIWAFLISLMCIIGCEKIKEKNLIVGYICGIVFFLIATVLGFVVAVDYYGYGILTVAAFYFFHGDEWWKKLLQIASLYFINVTIFGGMIIDFTIAGHTFEVIQQGLALLSMVFILLYNKEQGPHTKAIQYSFYLFYPVHMLILSLISLYLI